jgi:D-lactate dehydrogenase
MDNLSKQRLNDVNQLLAQHEGISESTYQQITEALEMQHETFGFNAKKQLKVAMFDARSYDIAAFNAEHHAHIQAINIQSSLNEVSAIQAKGCLAICVFVNDDCSEPVIAKLAACGVKLIALRCAGFNNVDLAACKRHEIDVVRVPEYSPHAVAEHTIGLMIMLNRKLHQAYMRNKNGQYVLDGLVGFDMNGKTVGVVGVGKIGRCLITILLGFGCKVLAYDVKPNEALQANPCVDFVPLETLFESSDIITLHAPLTKQTYHMVNADASNRMKQKVMIINTSRGALIDTKA